jgi:hypothetical protein
VRRALSLDDPDGAPSYEDEERARIAAEDRRLLFGGY